MRVINHGIIRHRGRRGDNVSTHPSGTARLNGLWKRDGKFFFMFSVSSMSSVSYSNFVFSAFSMVKSVMGLLLCLFLLSSCYYKTPALDSEELSKKTKDSLTYLYERHYTWNTNLEVVDDSISLECLPIKDTFIQLNRGDRVVVAEFAVHPADSVDSIWVKLAHTQDEQGWIREKELKKSFAPTDSISQAIHLFSDTHASYFVVIFALFVGAYLFRAFRRKQLQMVYFNDIDSVYPLFLCLLMAFSATIYESMQVFVPETWEHFYFNPTLSPFKVPFILSVFLLSIWLFLIVALAVLDDLFRQLTPAAAIFYLLGLMSCCIFCYFFFILMTHIYIGYLFLIFFILVFTKKVYRNIGYKYRCGHCGEKLKEKGHMLQTYNPNDIAEFQIMLQSTGKWFTDNDGNADFTNNDALKECYDVFKKLNESDFCQVVSDWTGFAGAINNGDVACVMRGSWITSTIMGADDQSGKWKMAPIPKMSTDGATHYSNQGGSSWFVLKNSKNADAAAKFLADTFGGSTELYDSLMKSNNIIGTYLPAADIEAVNTESEFFSGQQINKTLVDWEAQIPSVNTGAFSAEAQSALLAVTPNILNGSDLDTELAAAEEQFNQTIQ